MSLQTDGIRQPLVQAKTILKFGNTPKKAQSSVAQPNIPSIPLRSVPDLKSVPPTPPEPPELEDSGTSIHRPLLNELGKPGALTKLLQGKYDEFSPESVESLREDALTVNDLASSPRTLVQLAKAEDYVSKEHRQIVEKLTDPDLFKKVMKGDPSPEVTEIRKKLEEEPLIFHDFLAQPKALANFYSLIAETEKASLNQIIKNCVEELREFNTNIHPNLFENGTHLKFPEDFPEKIRQSMNSFSYTDWIDEELKKVEPEINPFRALYRRERNTQLLDITSKAFKNASFFKRYFIRPIAFIMDSMFIEEMSRYGEYRLFAAADILKKYKATIEQAEAQYEMANLMASLVPVLEPTIKEQFNKIEDNPLGSFEALLGPLKGLQSSDGKQVLMFQGQTLQNIQLFIEKAKSHYQEVPRPDGVKNTIELSIKGAMLSALFSGFIGLIYGKVSTLYNWLTNKIFKNNSKLRDKEQFIEDIVGGQMMKAHFDTYNIPVQSELHKTLSASAATVAREGFWYKFLLVFFQREGLMQLWDLLGKTPIPKVFEHLSVHIQPNSPFRKFMDPIKAAFNKPPIPSNLPDSWQWWLKWVPSGLLNKANEWIGPLIGQAHNYLDQIRVYVQDIPYLNSLLKFSLGNFPLKAEIFSGALSFSYNTITGLGTMALIDIANKNQGVLPKSIHQELEQKKYLKILRLYLQSIKQGIDNQKLDGLILKPNG